jgi:hypothetical protein
MLKYKHSCRKELNLFLAAYHSSTGVAPAQLIFKFNTTARLSTLLQTKPVESNQVDELAVANDEKAKAKMKLKVDNRLRVKNSNFKVGEQVLYKPPSMKIQNKTTN